MLFFGNPFLISGFVRRGWERIRMQKCREREREIESHPKDGYRPDKTSGNSQGERCGVCVYVTHISRAGNE